MPPTGDGASARTRSRSGVDPQHSLLEHTWDDENLLQTLREREMLREARLNANKSFKLKDDEVKGLLANYHLDVGEQARIGEFVIKKTQTAARSVSFDTSPSERISITAERGE